jgi:hypothetical protein
LYKKWVPHGKPSAARRPKFGGGGRSLILKKSTAAAAAAAAAAASARLYHTLRSVFLEYPEDNIDIIIRPVKIERKMCIIQIKPIVLSIRCQADMLYLMNAVIYFS